jgi:putative selenate reductase
MANHKGTLPGDEMYMSGRALYPITMNLFHRLVEEFDGELNVSYSAGADAWNVTTILACGARPITAASDLLKPGGYSRMVQWLEILATEMEAQEIDSLNALAQNRREQLKRAAAESLSDPRYKKSYFPYDLPKVASSLDLFDCIAAPCIEQCAVCQDVPEYAWLIGKGEYDQALQVILHRNPLPGITGYVCTHLCETRCTRNNYDRPVAIRNLKRFAFEQGRVQLPVTAPSVPQQVAIIGSGPSGLAAAYFLALNGVQVTIFEARGTPGGMCAIAPHFRIPPSVVQADIDRIIDMGVQLMANHPITQPPETLLKQGFDAVFVATGFQQDAILDIEGIEGEGVFTALRFLEAVARGEQPGLGGRVLVVGGGNTAMDAARTAQRLTGKPATVVYRRTLAEAPAEPEELEWLFEEGNELIELASPARVILKDGHVAALECVRNELGEPGPDGRRSPVPIEGSHFRIDADTIILAIGQKPAIGFLDGSGLSFRRDGGIVTDPATRRTDLPRVYGGGDVTRGPAIIIQACEDGRRAAEAMCAQFGIDFQTLPAPMPTLSEEEILQVKQARIRRIARREPEMLPVTERAGFACVELALSAEEASPEAGRCLQCSTFCDKCVEVCPNRANYTYLVAPVSWALPVLACQGGELVMAGQETLAIQQTRQILHVDDLCNECGNCATFCVHQGKPYADKPRLFLQEADFELETDNAFFIAGDTIRRREGGREASLSRTEGGFLFEDERVRLKLNATWEIDESVLKQRFTGRLSLKGAAEMAVILRGLEASLPFLRAEGDSPIGVHAINRGSGKAIDGE